jgi:hypothetical protein
MIEMMQDAMRFGDVNFDGLRNIDLKVGENLLSWIDAYGKAAGNQRSCWLGKKKRLVCMTWQDAEEIDTDEEEMEEEDI